MSLRRDNATDGASHLVQTVLVVVLATSLTLPVTHLSLPCLCPDPVALR